MANKSIEIQVMRVSSNGENIEFIINCPEEYCFTGFTIQVYGEETIYSVKSIFTDPEKKEYNGQIPISLLKQTEPQIYIITLTADLVDETARTDTSELTTEAHISDVSQVYTCMIDDILSLNSKCSDSEILDDLIRKYLILYAHTQALVQGTLSEADKYYHMMDNCFHPCSGNHGRTVSGGCGCGVSKLSDNHKKSSCGCEK